MYCYCFIRCCFGALTFRLLVACSSRSVVHACSVLAADAAAACGASSRSGSYSIARRSAPVDCCLFLSDGTVSVATAPLSAVSTVPLRIEAVAAASLETAHRLIVGFPFSDGTAESFAADMLRPHHSPSHPRRFECASKRSLHSTYV